MSKFLFKIIVWIIALSSGNSFAQLSYIGIKGGVQFKEFNDDLPNYIAYHDRVAIAQSSQGSVHPGFTFGKMGKNVGVFVQYKLHSSLQLQCELGFVEKGFAHELSVYEWPGSSFHYSKNYILNYLGLPVKLRKEFRIKKVAGIAFFIGPEIAFLIKDKMSYDAELNSSSDDFREKLVKAGYSMEDYSQRANAKFLNFTMRLGTGLFIEISNQWRLQGDIEFNPAFTNALSLHSSVLQQTFNVRPEPFLFSLGVGYKVF